MRFFYINSVGLSPFWKEAFKEAFKEEQKKAIKEINQNIMVEQAAGITNGQQVYDFIMAGSEAAGAASTTNTNTLYTNVSSTSRVPASPCTTSMR